MSIKKILKTILPLVLGGFLVWYSISNISIDVLIEYFKEANYSWIVLGLFFGVLSHLSRAYRWKFMLEPLGFKPKFTNNVLAVLVGYLVNLALPRAGEVSRALVLTNYEDVPFEKGFGTIVAERIADLIMMLSIMLITLFVQFLTGPCVKNLRTKDSGLTDERLRLVGDLVGGARTIKCYGWEEKYVDKIKHI